MKEEQAKEEQAQARIGDNRAQRLKQKRKTRTRATNEALERNEMAKGPKRELLVGEGGKGNKGNRGGR